jgi:hypothetical protein
LPRHCQLLSGSNYVSGVIYDCIYVILKATDALIFGAECRFQCILITVRFFQIKLKDPYAQLLLHVICLGIWRWVWTFLLVQN